MLKQPKQQFKVTIHQTKLVSQHIQSFYLKLSIGETSHSTDKIGEKQFDLSKSYNFDVSSNENITVELVACTKSLLFFYTDAAKLVINIDPSTVVEDNIISYTLKTPTNSNFLVVQLSFQMTINSIIKKKKEDSETKPRTRVNYSIDENQFKKDKPCIPKKLNTTSTCEKKSEKTQASNLDDTLVYDESCKSPDISNICNEFFSPKSQRNQGKDYINQTQIKYKNTGDNENENFHNLTANHYANPKIDKIFDTTQLSSNEGFDLEKANEFLKKLKKKRTEIKEREKKLLKEMEDLQVIKESKVFY